MDKTRLYVWEDSRKVMENEISGTSIPVTGTRGDHGGETQKTCSPSLLPDVTIVFVL
jgi:hypothetical protein